MNRKLSTKSDYAYAFQMGDEEALSHFFREFFPVLSLYASRWIQNRQLTEEIVSEAFVQTWKRHHKLGNYHGILAYLYKAVQRASQRAIYQEKRRNQIAMQSRPGLITNDDPYHHLIRCEVYRLIFYAGDKPLYTVSYS